MEINSTICTIQKSPTVKDHATLLQKDNRNSHTAKTTQTFTSVLYNVNPSIILFFRLFRNDVTEKKIAIESREVRYGSRRWGGG